MKNRGLKNPFPPWVYDLFGNFCHCWVCGFIRNALGEYVSALDHIMLRVSNSPFNAAPVHNQGCHLDKSGSIHSRASRKMLLWKTARHLKNIGYKPKQKDLDFISKHLEFYGKEETLQSVITASG